MENTILKGKLAADMLGEKVSHKVQECRGKGLQPTLAVLRIGENPSDLSYEKGLLKKMDALGIDVHVAFLGEDSTTEAVLDKMKELNEDSKIHGILMFRPLPRHLDERKIKNSIEPTKDVDAMSSLSLGQLLEGDLTGFVPCTALGVMELLKAHGVSFSGKKVVVVGRSTVIGKPVALLALQENATVTICHSKTQDLKETAQEADILIAAMGKAKFIHRDFVKQGAIIADVGINVDQEGKLCGDVDTASMEAMGVSYTPVPGGVGSVTTTVLADQVVKACLLQHKTEA